MLLIKKTLIVNYELRITNYELNKIGSLKFREPILFTPKKTII